WHGRTLRVYTNGEWKPMEGQGLSLPPITPQALHMKGNWTAPKLGPDQFTLTFDVPPKLRGLFVASPVWWVRGQPAPLAALTAAAPSGWLPVSDGPFFWEPPSRNRNSRRYVQEYRPLEDPTAGPPFRFEDPTAGPPSQFDRALGPLRNNP